MKYIDNRLKAKMVKLEDANNNYASENVEGALEEVSSQIKDIIEKDNDWIIVEDLLNGWTNTYEQYPARYKLNNGFLCIEYFLTYGTLGQPAFKLPVGFRPRTQCRFVTNIYEENGAIKYSRCEIGMDGNVTLTASKDGNQYGNIVIAL